MLKLKLQYFGHLMLHHLIRKDLDAGKGWRQEEKGTEEDEMVEWHHRFNGHEFEQALGDGMDREARHAAFHGVTESQTWFRDWTTNTNNSSIIPESVTMTHSKLSLLHIPSWLYTEPLCFLNIPSLFLSLYTSESDTEQYSVGLLGTKAFLCPPFLDYRK